MSSILQYYLYDFDCDPVASQTFTEDPQSGKIRWELPADKSPLNQQQLLNALREAGYGEIFIDRQGIEEALRAYVQHTSQQQPTNQQQNAQQQKDAPTKNGDAATTFVIGERRNGELRLDFDDSRMTATLHVTGPYGGKPVSLKQCAMLLKSAHIAHGLDTAALNEIAQQAQHLAAGQTACKVVARGTAAVNGVNATFESIAPTVKDRILTPRIREDGSVDYHELGAIPMVRTGDPLVRRIPPTPGRNGVTVTGEVCLAAPGKNLPFTLLQGAQVAPTDPNLLIATMEGMPVLIDCGMSVEKVYQVRNVNASTGNVTFEGGVVVEGDVASGFAVSADSDINIAGLVDSSRIVAGNDVIVNTGITGSMTVKTLTPSAFITAGNTIYTPFAQFAELHANVGIIAMNLLLHCKISSMDWVKLGGDKPGKSKLMGGEVRAVNLIKADTLGDPGEIKTAVHLLGDFAEYQAAHKPLVQRIAEYEHQIADVETARDRLKLKNLANQSVDDMLQRVEATLARTLDQLEVTRRELAALESAHQESCHRVRLVITRKAYPGVEITIGDRHVVLREEWGPGTIQYGTEGLLFNRGEITIPKTRKL